MITYGQGNTAVVADLATGKPLRALAGHVSPVTAVAFSPDGALLATASTDGTARTWDPATGQTRAILTGHTNWVTAVAFSPDGALLATASHDGPPGSGTWLLAAYAPPSPPRTPARCTGWRSPPTAPCWQPPPATAHPGLGPGCRSGPRHPHRLHRSSERGGVLPRRRPVGRPRQRRHHPGLGPSHRMRPHHPHRPHRPGERCRVLPPDGTLLATASGDGTTLVWDLATGCVHTTLTGHDDWVNAVAFSPDGALLATASDDGTTRIWDTEGACLATLLGLPDGGYAVLLPDGAYKLDGDAGDSLWWVVKLCRFAPGELDPYVPEIRKLPADAPILNRRQDRS